MDLNEKIEKAKEVLFEAKEKYNKIAVAWTGGKDSTIVLDLYRKFIGEPEVVIFIDTGSHFQEVHDFVDKYSKKWKLNLVIARNSKVLDNKEKYDLNDAFVKNQLLKTLPLHEAIKEHNIDAVVVGIRRDETDARKDENYFSERNYKKMEDYRHTRIHPILDFTERDVWDYTFQNKLPINPKYKEGYRSLGASDDTEKSSDKPAWEQDFSTPERLGRQQDKEDIMKKLRKWE